MQEVRDLEMIIRSKIPIIVIESYEEPRVLNILSRLGLQLAKPVFAWSITEGFKRIDLSYETGQRLTEEPDAALEHIKATESTGMYVLCDFHPYLADNPKLIRHLKEIAMQYDQRHHTLVLLSHSLEIPPEIKKYTAQFELRLPSEEQLFAIVREEASRWSSMHKGERVKTDKGTLQKLVRNLRGLTFADARRLARNVIFDDGAITDDELPEVNKAKFALMDMDGVLSFEYDTASFAAVGGLNNLKKWLNDRKSAFLTTDEVTRDLPKGIMLLGVQGGGKSLAAKAVAGTWSLPLLRLDFAALFNKYIGETEKNLREALKLADLMAPCVLWIDEIEKGLAGDDNDNGVSRRVLGTLLTWMAERKSMVFVVATSNDISRLPPELIRKGRMDEIFFVDLPDSAIREEIFTIHMHKREVDPGDFDLAALARASDGFAGAEIEQAVVAALYTAAARHETLNMNHLLEEIANTSPLSVVMEEKILALRHWAHDRTVPAN